MRKLGLESLPRNNGLTVKELSQFSLKVEARFNLIGPGQGFHIRLGLLLLLVLFGVAIFGSKWLWID